MTEDPILRNLSSPISVRNGMEFHLTLAERHDLTGQIYRQLRAAILDGRLRTGEQLLPTRELASQLGVSRNTVMQAYDLLMSDGLLEGHVGAGTFVADIVSSDRSLDNKRQSAIEIKPFWRQLTGAELLPPPPANLMYNFSLSLPDKPRFPFEEWRRISAFCSRRLAQAPVGYGAPEGMRELREAIVKYVSFSRAVRCHLDNVIVTNGAQQAFDLIARVLISPQTVVAVEDPGYPPVRLLFESYGAQVVGVPVDAQGLQVECLPKNAKLIYVTPSHQFPLGMPMSLPRRLALLEWATQHGAAIIEDDYDSEFRFAGRPLESLQNLDRTGRVLYVGTFSKVMFPEIRLGFIVAPELIQQALVVAKQLSDLHSPLLAQATLAKFILDGYLAKHIRKLHKIYDQRRQCLIEGLKKSFSDWLQPIPAEAGLHIATFLTDDMKSNAVIVRAAEQGIFLFSLEHFYASSTVKSGLIFGYGTIEVEQIDAGLDVLRKIFSKK